MPFPCFIESGNCKVSSVDDASVIVISVMSVDVMLLPLTL